MAFDGGWARANAYESGAAKWGHGINPIHAIHGASYGGRRTDPIHTSEGPEGPGGGTVTEELLDLDVPEHGYTDEDFADQLWGYGVQTGTADRPGMNVVTEEFRGTIPAGYPEPGYHMAGRPGGAYIRAQTHGDIIGTVTKTGVKEETVSEGWENKVVGGVETSETSDPSQYERQTSFQQLHQVRTGSQNPNTGTASEHVAPVPSERPTWAQRIKPWSGARRHYDMMPREQEERIRPFWYRRAGTGYVEYMAANEAWNYMTPPLQRMPVPDPYAGFPVPHPGNVYEEESYPVQDYVNVWW